HIIIGGIRCRQFVLSCERDNELAMDGGECASCDNETAILSTSECADHPFDLTGVAHIQRTYFDAEGWGYGLDRSELPRPRGYCGIPNHARAFAFRRKPLEQFQPFRSNPVLELAKTGRLAAGARQTVGISCPNRIRNDYKANRNRAGRPLH